MAAGRLNPVSNALARAHDLDDGHALRAADSQSQEVASANRRTRIELGLFSQEVTKMTTEPLTRQECTEARKALFDGVGQK